MSQDTEQSQQSPREIAEKLHRKIKRFIDADRHHYEPSGLYEIVTWIADAIESERESLAAKDREIAAQADSIKLHESNYELATNDYHRIHDDNQRQIAALQKENASLKEPPPVESWKDLVRLAYKEDPSNGALRINQITGHYNAMAQQRDALAEALKELRVKDGKRVTLQWTGENIAEFFLFLDPWQPQYIPGFVNSDQIFMLPDGQVVCKGDTVYRYGDNFEVIRMDKQKQETPK